MVAAAAKVVPQARCLKLNSEPAPSQAVSLPAWETAIARTANFAKEPLFNSTVSVSLAALARNVSAMRTAAMAGPASVANAAVAIQAIAPP